MRNAAFSLLVSALMVSLSAVSARTCTGFWPPVYSLALTFGLSAVVLGALLALLFGKAR